MVSGKPVVAVTVNHEGLSDDQIPVICSAIKMITGVPAFDMLRDQGEALIKVLLPYLMRNDMV